MQKKQWRKQFYEAMRRVCCRLVVRPPSPLHNSPLPSLPSARPSSPTATTHRHHDHDHDQVGLGFRPNCLAEDAFIHAVLGMAFELGWQRIAEHTAGLPEFVGDRDFSKVLKFAANEDVGNLLKGIEPAAKRGNPGAVDVSKTDVKVGSFLPRLPPSTPLASCALEAIVPHPLHPAPSLFSPSPTPIAANRRQLSPTDADGLVQVLRHVQQPPLRPHRRHPRR